MIGVTEAEVGARAAAGERAVRERSRARAFAGRLCSETLDEVYRAIEALIAQHAPPSAAAQRALLDVGCWEGDATLRFASAARARPFGVEVFPAPAAVARARGVTVAECDLERDALPFADASFDVIVVNQVLEHLKNIWLPLGEMYRVLRVGGLLVASVPNLASLHNRLMLALGMQPTSIRVRGPHVRGYTAEAFSDLLRLGGVCELVTVRGVGFHPLPPRTAGALARLWPSASHTPVFVARKLVERRPDPWTAWRADEDAAGVQTLYAAAGDA